jgi:L-fuconolactonase
MTHETIDAHHHLWKYSAGQYPWMSDGMQAIRRDFLIGDLEQTLQEARIAGTVVVQARQTLEETNWLLELALSSRLIRGVVGWVPLVDSTVSRELEELINHKKLKAVRHVVHDEPDDFYMFREDFNRGIAMLKQFNLVYDILIFERHLPQTIGFVDRHPKQVFVVDHIAKPHIKDGQIESWRENLLELARRENVYCKLSGMATEANWSNWQENDLQPYFNVVLEAFGPKRIMFGSDWPVLLLACPYRRWVDAVRGMIKSLSSEEQDWIMGATAKEAYRLG